MSAAEDKVDKNKHEAETSAEEGEEAVKKAEEEIVPKKKPAKSG